jgi:hypothetical protein
MGKRKGKGREERVPGVWAVLASRESAGMTRTPVCFHASSGADVGGGGLGVDDSAILGGVVRWKGVCTRIESCMRGGGFEALSDSGWRA